MENCYQPDRELHFEEGIRELEAPDFEDWLTRLSSHGTFRILVSMILKLERMAKTPLDPARRLAIMHRLVPLLRNLADDLPKVAGPTRKGKGGAGEQLSLEQRLLCLTVRNLKLALQGLDAAEGAKVSGRDAARLWILVSIVDCLGRQIELGARWDKPWPRRTWQELHDLYAYYVDRVRPAVDPGEVEAVGGSGTDLELAYKRLLLMGLLAEQGLRAMLRGPAVERMSQWARECELRDASAGTGGRGLFIVEMSSDAPPRRSQGSADTVRRTMKLRVGSELAAAMEAVSKGKPAFLKG